MGKTSQAKSPAPSSHVVRDTRPVGSAVAPCPLKEATKCSLKSLTIGKCGHKDRKYILVLPLAKGKEATPREYQVIAGPSNKPDKVQIEVKEKKPLCPAHKPEVIVISGHGEEKKHAQEKVTAEIFSDAIGFENWRNFIWIGGIQPSTYEVKTNACDGSSGLDAVIKAYPDLAWDLHLEVSLGGEEDKTESSMSMSRRGTIKNAEITNTSKSTDWSIKPSVKLTYNGQEKELSVEFQSYVEETLEILIKTRNFIDHALPMLTVVANTTVTLELPNLDFSYSASFKEADDDYFVDRAYKLGLKGSPFLGITGETDILNWILMMAGEAATGGAGTPLISAILKIKKRLETGYDGKYAKIKGKAAILFKAGAKIQGQISAEKKLKEKDTKFDGKIEGDIPITLEGVLSAEGEAMIVNFDGMLEMKARTGFGARMKADQDDQGLRALGQFYFSGLVITAFMTGSAGVSIKPLKKLGVSIKGLFGSASDDEDRDKNEHEDDDDRSSLSIGGTKKMEPWVLVEKYPPNEDSSEHWKPLGYLIRNS